jgi:hypothetical protein
MKCLKIDDEWLKLILSGKKTWEIRRTNTSFRGRIALGNTKSKKREGYATIIDSIEMPVQELKKHGDKHQANCFLDGYANGRKTLFAWVLKDIKTEPNPKPYSFSTGSWCKTI